MSFVETFGGLGNIAACLLLLLVTATITSRLILHPLSAYPGPLLAKLTNAHNGYHAMHKCLHITTRLDHLRYGSILRHGPKKLVFNTEQALHDIYDNQKVVKSHVYTVSAQAPGVYSSFSVINQQAHRSKRRITGQILNDQSMQIFGSHMLEQVDLFIHLLSQHSKDGNPVNITSLLEYLACDIIGLLAFGHNLNLQTDPSNCWFVEGMRIGNYLTYTRMQFYRMHQLKLGSIMRLLSQSLITKYKNFVDKIVATRTSQALDARHDLYSVAARQNADAVNTGQRIRESELWAEAVTFFPAGAFSTSSGISALFFYLTRNPTCYERLVQEIRSTFSSAEEIKNGPKLTSCKYLRACIDESLRMSPPIPGTLWREARADETDGSLIIDGHTVPSGTQFGVNAYAIHHNEEYFPNSYMFRPERWLDSSGDERERMLKAFSPFSIGYRGCPGKPLAYLESSLVVAKTVWHFDFKRASGKLGDIGGGVRGGGIGRELPDEYQLHDILSGAHNGPYLVFKARSMI